MKKRKSSHSKDNDKPNITKKESLIKPNSKGLKKFSHKTKLKKDESFIYGSHIWTVLYLVIFFYTATPFVLKIFPVIITETSFLHHLRWPPFLDLKNPSSLGLNHTKNFYLEVNTNVTVGIWHFLPPSLKKFHSSLSESDHARSLSDGHPIILYLHGNAGTRAGWHRVQLYKLLQKLNYHVVTLDYRGYADSTGSPSEDGVCEDALAVYRWIKRYSKNSPVILWGHSMGSGVATRISKELCITGEKPSATILESPFNNFNSAAKQHPFTLPFRYMPYFEWAFLQGLKDNGIVFKSDENIAHVTCPMLILHAEDDWIVDYSLGKQLYETALKVKKHGVIKHVGFNSSHGYGHKHIHKAPELPSIVKDFVEKDVL